VLNTGNPLDDISKAADNVLKEADKWLKDIIRNNYGVALATADLASEVGRLSLRWWLGEQYRKGKESDST
jgi:hypothetical protein